MIVRLLLLAMVTTVYPLHIAAAGVTARVAVLPFEIYTTASTAYLKDTIAHDLSSLLAQEEGIAVVDQASIKDMLAGKTSFSFNEAALTGMAEKLEAPFIVLGSMTRIGEDVSLDTYVFAAHGTSSFSKLFVEGKNLNSLIKELAQKITSQILATARTSPEGVAAEEQVHGEIRETIPEAATVAPETPAAGVAGQLHGIPDEEISGREAGEAIEEESPPAPGGQAPAAPLRDQEGVSAAGEGEPSTPAGLPEVAADRSSEQPPANHKKKRKDKSLSSPFSTMKPIQITSESMEADNRKSIVTFKGNVVVKQEDIVIFSDIMQVAYESKGGISRVEASGNVKMSQDNRIATGRKLTFYNPEQKIVMTGDPKIWQGDNLISCEKVTVLLEEDKIFFEGAVDSVIYPKSLQEQDSKSTPQVEAITLPPQDPASEQGVPGESAVPLQEGAGQDTAR